MRWILQQRQQSIQAPCPIVFHRNSSAAFQPDAATTLWIAKQPHDFRGQFLWSIAEINHLSNTCRQALCDS